MDTKIPRGWLMHFFIYILNFADIKKITLVCLGTWVLLFVLQMC